MNKRILYKIMAGLWTLAAVGFCSLSALAADTVEVKGSGTYGGSTSAYVGYEDKDLFSNMKGLMPGDVISNTITLHNQSSRGVTIYLKAFPDFVSQDTQNQAAVREDSQASADGKTFRDSVLNIIHMTLTLGEKVIYQGSADGLTPEEGFSPMTDGAYGISLGYFKAGQKEDLTVTLKLPGQEMGNAFEQTFDAVDWVFCIEGTTPPDDDDSESSHTSGSSTDSSPIPVTGDYHNLIVTDPGKVPKMGDEGTAMYVFVMLLAVLTGCSAIYTRKRYRS